MSRLKPGDLISLGSDVDAYTEIIDGLAHGSLAVWTGQVVIFCGDVKGSFSNQSMFLHQGRVIYFRFIPYEDKVISFIDDCF